MARILIVEDEDKIARFIELELAHEGYQVDKATDGRSGVEMALSCDYDLILLDVMLPQISGMEVLRRVRRQQDTPIILLTARDAVMDKVAGLDAGADDYVTKPFAIEELLARIRVALKRHSGGENEEASGIDESLVFACGVTLDPERHEVRVGQDPVELTHREFELLRVLMENKNVVMRRERLVRLALGYDFVGETNVIDVYVRHLRAKIDERHNLKLISTVRGVGYVVREP